MDTKTVQAHALALATQVVGLLIAFLPSLAPEKQLLIGVGSTVLAASILIAHAVRSKHLPAPAIPTSLGALVQDAQTLTEVAKLLAPLAQPAPTAKALPAPTASPPPRPPPVSPAT